MALHAIASGWISGGQLERALALSTAAEINRRILAGRRRGKAVYITVAADGTVRARYLDSSKRPSLATAQRAVGGRVAPVDGDMRDRGHNVVAYAADELPEGERANYGAAEWLNWPYPIAGVVVLMYGFDNCGEAP